jgi:hypothetical protein
MSLMPPHNPEIDLLLCCSRTHLDSQITERINSLAQKNIDWEYLLKTALRHRVMPLLYRSLKSAGSNGMPDEAMEKLRSQYLANAARNLYLTHELLKILALMEEEDILAVPFKGPVLAKSIFGDITLRQFSDLDILIHPNHALKARNLLMANEYRPEIQLDDKQFRIYLKSKDASTFICDEKKAFVDLHWGLKVRNVSFPIHPDHFDNHLKPVVIEGHKVHNLPPEDLLLYLCVHGALHCWDSLGWISCVAELIRSNPDLNYERITQMVRRVKCERIFFLGLFLAQDLLGAEPPEKINKYLKKDPNIESLAIEVYRNLFHENDKLANSRISNKFSAFHIKVRDRHSEKIRHIAQTVMCPTKEDWRRFPLPASISFLHYLLRPTRLSLEILAVLFKKCFKTSIA